MNKSRNIYSQKLLLTVERNEKLRANFAIRRSYATAESPSHTFRIFRFICVCVCVKNSVFTFEYVSMSSRFLYLSEKFRENACFNKYHAVYLSSQQFVKEQ